MKKVTTITIILIAAVLFAFKADKTDQANKFLNSLNQKQRSKAQMNFETSSKFDWHYLPATMYPRAGIALNQLNGEQKKILFELLHSSLSEAGYAKTQQIISLENVLSEIEGDKVMRDSEKYYTAFYGNPVKDSLWSWSFQGHHISLNFTVLNGETSIAPRFFGANPAIVKEGSRKGERTLAKEDDLGLELINSCSAEQKQKAIFQHKAFTDIATTNSADVGPLQPVGIKMNELNDSQQTILLHLIDEYLANMPDDLAAKRMENLKKEETAEINFGWAGATKLGEGHYYRIQGLSFLIEFDNTQNNANHIHSVWRDFDGDFGRDLIREHYQSSEHHH
jgi:uncharacterized protein YxeA